MHLRRRLCISEGVYALSAFATLFQAGRALLMLSSLFSVAFSEIPSWHPKLLESFRKALCAQFIQGAAISFSSQVIAFDLSQGATDSHLRPP